MSRAQIIFVLVVFLAVLAGYLAERQRGDESFSEIAFAGPRGIELEPFEFPVGDHRLEGRVRTPDGDPAAEVQVLLELEDPGPGRAVPLPWTLTDENGDFVLEGLLPGVYDAALLHPGREPTSVQVRVPEELEVAWTLTELLPPLEELPLIERADLLGRLEPPRGFTADAWPVAGYEVLLLPDKTPRLSGAVVRRARTGADGAFRFEDLVAAAYRVQVLPPWARGGTWPILHQAFHIHEPTPPPDSRLRLVLTCGEVFGRLSDDEGHPIEGALVKIRSQAPGSGSIWPPVATDVDGSYRLRDLPAGTYSLRVRAGGAAVDVELSLEAGERREVLLDPLDVH